MFPLLLVLMFSSPQTLAGNYIAQYAMPPRMISITLNVDFGPAGKPAYFQKLQVRDGSTAKQAVLQAFPLEYGAVCCHPEEVKGIDGVSVDPLNNYWWRLKINGTSKKVSPYKTHLKAGDVVEWIYFEESQ